MAHGFSHLTARKKVRTTTGGGYKQPRGGAKGGGVRGPSGPPAGGKTHKPVTIPNRPKKKGMPYPKNPTRRKKAVDYVIDRQKKKGNVLTRQAARKRVKRNVIADRKNRAYKYDFAGDGAGKKDRDYDTPANRAARRKAGYKTRIYKGKKRKDGPNPKPGPKGDRTTSANDAGNSQSDDSYGGPQSAGRQLSMERKKKKKKKRNRNGNG